MLLVVLLITSAAAAVRDVTLSKCCPQNLTLDSAANCAAPPGGQPAWNLRVYSPSRQNFLPLNRLPDNWRLEAARRPPCSSPELLLAVQVRYMPFENGSLYMLETSRMLHPQDFCIDHNGVLVCQQEAMTVAVKKCCGHDAIFSQTNETCIYFKSQAYKIDTGGLKMLAGFPRCEHQEMAIVGKLKDAVLEKNGSLVLEGKLRIGVGNFCLENVLEDAGAAKIVVCREHVAVKVEKTTNDRDLRFTIYPIGLALSAVFLAATLAAGAILPASHHVLQWRCQTNHVACLLGGDVLLCITHLSGRMQPTVCVAIAVCMHFLFLAAFFWLNTMCFNIWWTFRDLRPQSMEKSQERCRLRLYMLYAWGVPLIIASTAAILDSIPEGSDFLRPKFGVNTCWFYGNMEIFTFFYGPVGVVLFINLALFALTARELTCGLWKRELVKSTSERAALGRVCMKLVVVMGVTWIADIVSWLVGGPQELWYLTDLINCSQGVFIFIVVGCQPQVLSAVKRLWCFRKRRANGTAGTTNHHSSSSQAMPSMGDTVTNHSVTNNTTKSVPLETSC